MQAYRAFSANFIGQRQNGPAEYCWNSSVVFQPIVDRFATRPAYICSEEKRLAYTMF